MSCLGGRKRGRAEEKGRLVSWHRFIIYMTVHVIGPPLPWRTSGLDMTVQLRGPPLPWGTSGLAMRLQVIGVTPPRPVCC